MADLVTSANVDTLMQAANFAAFRTSLGLTAAATTTLTLTDSTGTLTIPNGVALTGPVASGTASTLGNAEVITGLRTFTPTARSSGATPYFVITTPADTGQTASTESIGVSFTAGTRTWVAGALATQREHVFAAPTFAFASASTLTTAINVDIADPVAGTNATFTNAYALRTASLKVTGNAALDGTTTAGTVNATTLNVTSSITLAEGGAIALDPAGSSDGAWSGITMTGTSGYSQAFGDVVMLDPNQSPARWELASVSAAAGAVGDCRGNLAMVVVTGTDGNSCTLLRMGNVRADANFPTLTINGAVYATTTGDVTSTQPTTTDHVIRIIGEAITADEIFFSPSSYWQTHT